MPLERSPEYLKKLAEVRRMPQAFGAAGETAEEEARREGVNEEKREAARALRMETLLDNAQCAKLLTEYLQERPGAAAEEFEHYLQAKGKITHPESAASFITELIVHKERVEKASRELSLQRDETKQGVGKRLYRWALPMHERFDQKIQPQGPVTADRTYPLALILYVPNEKDFNRIDQRENIGGFYDATKYYTRQQGAETRPAVFPFIVVKASAPTTYPYNHGRTTTVHEKGHAENRVLQASLGKEKIKVVWGGDPKVLSWTEARRLEESWTKDFAAAESSKDWKEVQAHCLARAKDEFLADYKAQDGDLDGKLGQLKKREGVYDYIKELGFPPGSLLYDALWGEYEAKLEEAVNAVKPMTSQYYPPLGRAALALGRRGEVFRWVLAQIPLAEWKKELEAMPFEQEAWEIQEASLLKTALYRKYRDIEAVDLEKPELKAMQEFDRAVYQEQEKPLFGHLRKFKRAMESAGIKPALPQVPATIRGRIELEDL